MQGKIARKNLYTVHRVAQKKPVMTFQIYFRSKTSILERDFDENYLHGKSEQLKMIILLFSHGPFLSRPH